jgi:formamidopyrimidine-DNA glycosylase
MPELPEVEVTARALAQRFDGRQVEAVRIHNFNLRWRVSRTLPATVAGQRIEHIGRRGKYLLWHLPSGVLISHLGMSGSWRIHEAGRVPPRARHDHVELHCDGAVARLNDPRRFGALLWHARSQGDVLGTPLLATPGHRAL